MGVSITSDAAPAGSSYDQWKIYRATSKTGSYSLVTTQNLTDLTYYDEAGTSTNWYKTSFYNSSSLNESALSNPIKPQTEYYTTVKKVERFLHISALTDSSTPAIQDVEDLIQRKMDYIDQKTGHAWRTRYSETVSGKDTDAKYDYYDLVNAYKYQTGIAVYLKHRRIKQFSAAEGDAIELFNGNTYLDYLATYTEGRNNDYWVDYEKGKLFIRSWLFNEKPLTLRLKYRYGENAVMGLVEDICTKLVAYDMLFGDDRSMLLPEGSDNLSIRDKAGMLDKWCEEKLLSLQEFQVPSTVI